MWRISVTFFRTDTVPRIPTRKFVAGVVMTS